MRRILSATLLGFVLASLIAPAASAATVKRLWWTNLGTGAANGRITVQGYLDGTGSIAIDLKGLKPNATYSIRVRAGSCSRVGDLLYDGGYLRMDGSGAGSTAHAISLGPMNRIWGKVRFYPVSIRVTSGTSQRCGLMSWNKITRIALNAYGINLPVIASSGYPKCDVAMYLRELAQPREPGVTYVYAHARKGMFLPLLDASKVNNGAGMIGKLVRVYTTDSKMITYQIDRVRRHVKSIQNALGITTERLWLQTSEGPNSTYPKLIVEAHRISIEAVSYATAHPAVHARTC